MTEGEAKKKKDTPEGKKSPSRGERASEKLWGIKNDNEGKHILEKIGGFFKSKGRIHQEAALYGGVLGVKGDLDGEEGARICVDDGEEEKRLVERSQNRSIQRKKGELSGEGRNKKSSLVWRLVKRCEGKDFS